MSPPHCPGCCWPTPCMCRRHLPPPTRLSGHWSVPWRTDEVYGCRGELEDFACQRQNTTQLGFDKTRTGWEFEKWLDTRKVKSPRAAQAFNNTCSSCGWWCSVYHLGLVGGDLEGRLFVSRYSDEMDLCSTGFHSIPPTTRWHTGPLWIIKKP